MKLFPGIRLCQPLRGLAQTLLRFADLQRILSETVECINTKNRVIELVATRRHRGYQVIVKL